MSTFWPMGRWEDVKNEQMQKLNIYTQLQSTGKNSMALAGLISRENFKGKNLSGKESSLSFNNYHLLSSLFSSYKFVFRLMSLPIALWLIYFKIKRSYKFDWLNEIFLPPDYIALRYYSIWKRFFGRVQVCISKIAVMKIQLYFLLFRHLLKTKIFI